MEIVNLLLIPLNAYFVGSAQEPWIKVINFSAVVLNIVVVALALN